MTRPKWSKEKERVVTAAMFEASMAARYEGRPCSHGWGKCERCDMTRWRVLMQISAAASKRKRKRK